MNGEVRERGLCGRRWKSRAPCATRSTGSGRNPRMRLGPPSEAPLVLFESCNQVQEGGYVLPTDEYGYDYGRAIAEALGVGWVDAPKQTLSVTTLGKGVVRSTPPGITCPPTCSAAFGRGVEVALKGTAARGHLAPLVDRLPHWRHPRPARGARVRGATVKARFEALVHAGSVTLRIRGGQLAGAPSAPLMGTARVQVRDSFESSAASPAAGSGCGQRGLMREVPSQSPPRCVLARTASFSLH